MKLKLLKSFYLFACNFFIYLYEERKTLVCMILVVHATRRALALFAAYMYLLLRVSVTVKCSISRCVIRISQKAMTDRRNFFVFWRVARRLLLVVQLVVLCVSHINTNTNWHQLFYVKLKVEIALEWKVQIKAKHLWQSIEAVNSFVLLPLQEETRALIGHLLICLATSSQLNENNVNSTHN